MRGVDVDNEHTQGDGERGIGSGERDDTVKEVVVNGSFCTCEIFVELSSSDEDGSDDKCCCLKLVVINAIRTSSAFDIPE
jgi:hypothetical protein